MKLHSITVKNVKSFKEAVAFTPHKTFNVLIGSNGGGKSNLMEIVYITLRHFFVYAYKWIPERGEDGTRLYINRESQPFGIIGKLLTKYLGDTTDSEIVLQLEVTESDIENIVLIKQHAEELNRECGNFYFVDDNVRFFLSSQHEVIKVGEVYDYHIINNALQANNDIKARYYLSYLKSIEAFRFLAQGINVDLYPAILYISPFRGVSNQSLEQSLADATSNGERTEVMKSTSRSTSSLIRLATLYFAEKRRKYESAPGGWEGKWRNDTQVRFVNDSLAKIGYSWDMELINPNRNTYIIKLKKDGNDFLLNQASSGEVELINFIFGMITLGLKGGVIIVDEPELHLHPKWIAFLRGFFMEYAFREKNQLMIITHSATFINTTTYQYITRIYRSAEGNSRLYQVVGADGEETKEKLHFINATNNEKVFFADFVIMVEGDTDEIVFKRILEQIKRDKGIKANVEVMQIRGKGNYEGFNSFLKTLQISSCFIGDIDNIAQFAKDDEQIKGLLVAHCKKADRMVIKNSGSKDYDSLTEVLADAIKSENLEQLKEFYEYMLSFRLKLKPDLTEEEKQMLNAFIDSQYDNNVYILRDGEIESYFPEGFRKKDLENVLQLTQEGVVYENWKKEEGFADLYGLMSEILDRNNIK